jgi:hypothetical protein
LLTFACACLAFSLAGGHAQQGDKQAPKGDPESAVRLRLSAVELAVLQTHYETLLKRELSGKENARQFTGVRAKENEAALKELRGDLETIRRRMVELETERQKLLLTLGKAPETASPQDKDRTIRMLLDRLNVLEKRVEKLEKQK